MFHEKVDKGEGKWNVGWDDFDSDVQCYRVCISPSSKRRPKPFFVFIHGHSRGGTLKFANKLIKLLNQEKEEKDGNHSSN